MARAWVVRDFADGDGYAIPLHDLRVPDQCDPIEWLESLMRGDLDD